MAATSVRPAPTIEQIRAQFPSIASDFAFLENAGGSQVPAVVADAIRDYMLNSYVQLGAGYAKSIKATEIVDQAHAFVNRLMNGEGVGAAILGPSTTQLVTMLAECYSRALKPGDKIIVAETGHEANIGPWMNLQRFGIEVNVWPVNPTTFQCDLGDLDNLLADGKTKLVTFPHVSNLLGEVVDVETITKRVHAKGAKVVVDGVAYAPHRLIDVKSWDVDWYVYSCYKVYGPHMAALYGRQDAIEELTGPNHFFIPKDTVPYKFQLGGANHEGCAGLVGLGKYLNFLAGAEGEVTRNTIEVAFNLMAELELPLQNVLVKFLLSKNGVKIIGPASAGYERVPTIGFTREGLGSIAISNSVDVTGKFGIRFGHMYAYRMCKALGIDTNEGVVRVSMVHYNTVEEVAGLIETLDQIL